MLPLDHLGQRVSQWLFTQPLLKCSTAPSLEPSRNRAMIRAGAALRLDISRGLLRSALMEFG
jgi:hypothetical protein